MKPRLKNKSGFSLIEMMVVVALIGLMAAIAVPSFRGLMQKGRLKAAGREITMDLLLERASAISSGNPQVFVFDVTNGAWAVPGLGVPMTFTKRGYFGIAFQHSSGDPIQFKDSAGVATDNITFNPDGTLANDLTSYTNTPGVGKIYLIDTKGNMDKMTIEVSQYTGLARLVDGWTIQP